MIGNWLWLIVIVTFIFIEIYMLSKYLAVRSVIFIDNRAASFLTSALVWLVITFVTMFPFLWIDINILYLIIIFTTKEVITWIYLIIRRGVYMDMNGIISFIFILMGSLLITFIYNFGISELTKPGSFGFVEKFQIIGSLVAMTAKITEIEIIYIHQWALSFIVSFIALTSILGLMREYSYSQGLREYMIGIFITMLTLILFSFKLPLWGSGQIYIGLYMLIILIRLITFSRRRYGVLFAITVINLYVFGDTTRLIVWFSTLVTLIIYTALKKPQPTLFFAMLISPLLMLEAMRIYTFYAPLSFLLVAISLITYIFMLSAQASNILKKVDKIVVKGRYWAPAIILLCLYIGAIVYASFVHVDFKELSTFTSSLYYPLGNNFGFNIFMFIVSLIIFIVLSWYIYKKIKNGINFARFDYVLIFCFLFVMFLYNPLVDALLSNTTIGVEIKYGSAMVSIPLYVLAINKITQRKIV